MDELQLPEHIGTSAGKNFDHGHDAEIWQPDITALETVKEENIVICGKGNGDVVMFPSEDGSELEVLYCSSRTVFVVSVAIGAYNGTVASTDASGRIIVTKVARRRSRWSRAVAQLDIRVAPCTR